MRYQDSVTINGTIENVLADLRISQIPLTSAGVAVSLAAIAKAAGGTAIDGVLEIAVFIGGRQVIERAQLGALGQNNVVDVPSLPDDLLVSGEPGLPGELIQLQARNSGADDIVLLSYSLDVTEV